ncbi:hypothetical protein EDB82DRAFT_290441 [Fusarium venenatum]|uniref:uncharacterized protein n=1 Tax=Fusarium venenatum TaxID=56646 RepID=UPI001DBA6FEA|nr:hypothetical protein EDB82DRAFT_290441 [Fusarium venenatum]
MRTIQACAKSNSIAISLGFSGRTESNSLYIYQVIINPEGEIAVHHRKLKPRQVCCSKNLAVATAPCMDPMEGG